MQRKRPKISPPLESPRAEAPNQPGQERQLPRWLWGLAIVIIALLFLPVARGLVVALITLPEVLLVELEWITGVGIQALMRPSPFRALIFATAVVLAVVAVLRLRGGARPDSASKA